MTSLEKGDAGLNEKPHQIAIIIGKCAALLSPKIQLYNSIHGKYNERFDVVF